MDVAVASTDSKSPPSEVLSKGDTITPLLDSIDGNSATPMMVNDWTVPKMAREKSRAAINGESFMFMVLFSSLQGDLVLLID